MHTDLEQNAKLLLREAYARRRWVIAGFVLISLAVLAVGVQWPKSYETSTTIYVDNTSIVGQLMEGAAVGTTVTGDAESARAVILSHDSLQWVLQQASWVTGEPTAAEQSMLMDAIRQKSTIGNAGENLLTIRYRDSDPQRAYETTQLLAKVFLREMREAKQQESEAAFAFIDRQVRQYEKELAATEARLEELGIDPELAAAPDIGERISALWTRVDDLRQQLQEAQISQQTLQQQVTQYPRQVATNPQLQELQSQLAQLRTQYHESYPDIVALKAQIAQIKQNGGGGASADPVYQNLQSQLYQANTQVKTLQARLQDAQQRLTQVTQATTAAGEGGQFEQLLRDYRINQESYADLLKRRETARVSKNLDAEQQGLTLRISQPAYLPHQGGGPRLLHFAVAGLLLGAFVPLGTVFALTQVDPRLRKGSTIQDDLGLPLLAVVPHLETPREARAHARGAFYTGAVIVLTLAGVAAVLVLRLQGVI